MNEDKQVDLSVAIVDDDPQLVMIYRHLFSYRKVPVFFVAYDGVTALERFRKADPKPSVFIIDYRMPGMNGIELTKEILEMAPGTKIIVISGDDSVKLNTLKAGASAFLNKPAGINDIMASINLLTGR
ncbi:MAG TPA: response regulator transcription factor [Methanocella sp.]|jgi:DNA-binding NarL/FixJ family response regulator